MSAIKAGSPAASRMGAQTLRAKAKPYLFLAPMLLFAAAFIYYPFFKTFLFSFTTVNFMGEITGWAGLDNFRYLFSRRDFSTALTNSLKLTAMNVPLTLIITITLALLATRRRKLSPV
ncbi:MAG: sugar ABC transporter permease, partial [Clostridiales bacterium]|nr:sugar ABC transporter permease [Clostridiales bacterium]